MNRPLPAVTKTEVGLLAALMFVLPLLEVPKNLLWSAWVVVSCLALWRDAQQRKLEGLPAWRWSRWDGIFLALLATALLAGLGLAEPGRTLKSSGDMLRMMSVPWILLRRGYRIEQLIPVCWSAVAGTLLAVGWGFVSLLRADVPMFLQLNSVGHVNHSSIYLAIVVGVSLALVVARMAAPGRLGRAGAVLASILLSVALLVASSRASVGAAFVLVLLLAWIAPFAGGGVDPERARLRRRRFRIGLLVLVVATAGAYRLATSLSDKRLQPEGQSLLEKFGFQAAVGAPASHRDGLLRLAWAAARAHPLVGLGHGGFGRLTAQNVCEKLRPEGEGKTCDPGSYYFAPHAHSLYAHTLAERGVLGLIAVLMLLAGWVIALRRSLNWARDDARQAAIWMVCLAGCVITMFAGLLNTTLHHEHGLLAMTTLGMLLSAWRVPGDQRR